MRFVVGTLFGIVLVVGAAFVHDNNVPADPPSVTTAERQVVNWDVLGATVREQTAFIRRLWDRVVGR